jgi:hypothetical protein
MNQVILTARHRKCLQNGCYGGPQGENEAQLYTGQKVRQECLDQGWLERLPDSLIGFRMYRTTETGRAMLNVPIPKKPSFRKPLATLKPLVATLDTRTAKPLTASRKKKT